MTVPLISRKAWGAKEQDGFYDRPMPFSEFWLHHSVTIAPDLVAPFDDDDEAVRTLERIGESRFGGGISYNQPITPVGRCYVGVSEDRVGAHTKGHNTAGFAFVLVGNYDDQPPTAIQEEIIARRMVELHRAGKATRHTLNGGHRNVFATSCPGDAAYARIPAINARANQLWDLNYPKNDIPLEGFQEDEVDISALADELRKKLLNGNHIKIIGTGTSEENPARYMSLNTALRVIYDRAVNVLPGRLDEQDAKLAEIAAVIGEASGTELTTEEILERIDAAGERVAKARLANPRVSFDEEVVLAEDEAQA